MAEAVAYFREHGRISQPVMEASIFRAPYFVGRFLPSLLSPSLVEEASRNGLIAALSRFVCVVPVTHSLDTAISNREKKVPTRMLRNYEKASQELRTKGNDGVTCILLLLSACLQVLLLLSLLLPLGMWLVCWENYLMP